ncbi:MAG TPA: Bax inhibitor-1/YccA family protein [Micromonosporaceae bacterium]
MRSHNPVLTRLTPETQVGYREPASYAGQTVDYPASVIAPAATERMTIDDVVVRTVALLALVGLSGAAAWNLVPRTLVVPAMIGAAMVGLVLGLVISFMRVANPLVIGTYAVVEGVFVGIVSLFFETVYPGIVVQAVVGTFGIFLIMALLYKSRVIRATPRFVRMVTGAVIGVFAIMLVNLLLSLFGVSTGLREGGWLGIAFSLVCIVVASLTFVLDFAQIEEGIRQGLPRRYAWVSAFGILVGLIWLYLEILRLLSYLRGDD